MKHIKFIRRAAAAVSAFFAVFALSLCPTALAEDDGAYTAPTNTYYLNPDTGVTDDGGSKNAALGEGMCRSVVYKDALVELDGGKIYATVRLQLISNMKDFRLYVQDGADGDYTKESPRSYSKVTPRVMTEDAGADTADYRFEIPSVTAYMSWEMYVIPMGRDVKFYMNLSDELTPGGGDFVVSVKPKASPEPTLQADPPSPAPTQSDTPEPSAAPTPSPDAPPSAPPVSLPPEELPTPTPDAPPSEAPALAVTSAPEDTPSAAPDVTDIPDKTPTSAAPEPAPTSGTPEPEPATPDVPGKDARQSGTGGIILTVVIIAIVAAAVIIVPKLIRRFK
ncbi:MAG: NEAT domain-containing protein [Oscillospiraceae bacterium]|jgi:hypothetical protein|nr:NEAT domain-containing protein [Oscillospiraceae bacterium]